MFTHIQIWTGLDRLAESCGYSPSGLAKKAGLDPTSFNKSKRISPDGKPRWPSTESLAKVLSATNATMSDFIALIDPDSKNCDEAYLSGDLSARDISLHTAKILLDTQSVLFRPESPFTLKSGRQSPVYIDGRRLISFPKERSFLMDCAAARLYEEIGNSDIDLIAGGETAGIPYGALIADRLDKPMIYVRKEPKGYGRMAQIEGVLPETGSFKAVLVEDLQTDGGSKKIFIDALRNAGATVEHTFVIFHYGIFPASQKNIEQAGVTLHALATWWDVLKLARNEHYFDQKTLDAVERFLNNPNEWTP